MEHQALTVMEAAAVLRIGRNAAYEAVRAGQIPSIRVGHRLLIPRVALDQMLSQPVNAGKSVPTNDTED